MTRTRQAYRRVVVIEAKALQLKLRKGDTYRAMRCFFLKSICLKGGFMSLLLQTNGLTYAPCVTTSQRD